MSSSNKNIFSLHYYSYKAVKRRLSNFIHDVFLFDKHQLSHPKCINLCCNVNTVNIMIRFGIVDSHQSIKKLKNYIGLRLFIRLVAVCNMLTYLPYQRNTKILKYCYEKR